MCEYLCIEQQVLSHSKVIKQYVMLGTEPKTASDQSHVLTDVVTIDISPATGWGKQTCKYKGRWVSIIKVACMFMCVFS